MGMSRSGARFGLSAAVLLSAAMLLVPGIVQAHKKKYPATVTATAHNKNVIEGQVHSVPRCLGSRSVGIYSSYGALEATGVTDTQGKFRISDPKLAAGAHTVTVRRKVIRRTKRHRHICLAASTSVTTT
jgi:hypothetical protein